jgi:hypothetical protein
MCLISPLGVPSCFTPVMQQFCIGWDAILVELEGGEMGEGCELRGQDRCLG